MTTEPDTISVGIPAYGPCPHLDQVIDRLLSQTVPPAEIIVVHSGPGDPTAALAAKDPRVRVLHRDRRLFAGAARNIAADHSRGAWQAFIDADVLPADTWLDSLLRAAQARPDRYVVGSVGYARSGGYWGLALWTIEFAGLHPYLPSRETNAIASCTLLLPAAALARVGGFPSRFAAAEDTVLAAKLRGAGYSPWFQADARVDHLNIAGFRHFAEHLYLLGRHSALARRAVPLRGRLVTQFWPLAAILFVSKFADTYARALAHGRGYRRLFATLSPAVLLGLVIWNIGFIGGLHAALPPIDRDRATETLANAWAAANGATR